VATASAIQIKERIAPTVPLTARALAESNAATTHAERSQLVETESVTEVRSARPVHRTVSVCPGSSVWVGPAKSSEVLVAMAIVRLL